MSQKKVVLGVTGCIGAYKAAEIVRGLKKEGFAVQVIMTASAQEFITPLTLETLSESPVISDLFGPRREEGARHISLTEECDLFLVAPATANILAKFASGIADDFLSTFFLANRAPVLVAPAMNTQMLEHPAVKANIAKLRERGAELHRARRRVARLRMDGKGKTRRAREDRGACQNEIGKGTWSFRGDYPSECRADGRTLRSRAGSDESVERKNGISLGGSGSRAWGESHPR